MNERTEEIFARTERLFGKEAMRRLAQARVAVFGLGGVGGYAAEGLARAGIGSLDLIDNDTVNVTNINRQIYATLKTVGRYKTDVAAERIADINPAATVRTHKIFYLPDTSAQFDFTQYDYIVDAIDTVAGKIELAVNAVAARTPIISCMGTGNKTDPAALEVADIGQTSVCPLARVMRAELRKRGIERLKVVYSKEKPLVPVDDAPHGNEAGVHKKQVPGSTSFVPSVAGLIMAGEVVKDILGLCCKGERK